LDLVTRTEQTLRADDLLREGESVLVAVSGGPDSMALLHVLVQLADRWRIKLVAAHVDHMFRGEESADEAEFVARYAASVGIPCEVAKIDIPAKVKQYGGNSQAAAREERYRFLLSVAKRYRCSRIALAHHADDQAETVLMRLLRGTGPSGLAGMPIRRIEDQVELIRPFLRIYKQSLEAYCKEQGIEYRTDSSNLERKYRRNRIRLELLPYLKKYNPQLPEALNRLAEMVQSEDDFLDKEASRVVLSWSSSEGRRGIPRKEYVCLHLALQRRCLKLILNYVSSEAGNIDFSILESVREAILQEHTPNLRLDLPGCVMLREYDQIRFVTQVEGPSPPEDFLWTPQPRETSGTLHVGPGLTLEWDFRQPDSLDTTGGSRQEAWFDAEALRYPLRFRPRRNGDRFQPIGLNGSKKVKDMYVDDKVPPVMRERLPLMEDRDGFIVWVPGIRRSTHALVSETTSRVLYMKLFIE
jgi:tRNA(Ile)-lysidine synthase